MDSLGCRVIKLNHSVLEVLSGIKYVIRCGLDTTDCVHSTTATTVHTQTPQQLQKQNQDLLNYVCQSCDWLGHVRGVDRKVYKFFTTFSEKATYNSSDESIYRTEKLIIICNTIQ